MLRARIIWIPVIFEKYNSKYQGLSINSPATTNPELYNPQPMQAFHSMGSQLLGLMRNILYMAEAAMERQKRRIAKGRKFKEIWDVPDQLAAVFPYQHGTATRIPPSRTSPSYRNWCSWEAICPKPLPFGPASALR